jgi:Ger(x)C family germination protein
MKRAAAAVYLLLAGTLLSSGCWDAKELEETLYLNAMGIDYKDGSYIVYTQLINFTNVGKSESGVRRPESVWIGRGYGPTLDIATDNIYSSAQQSISWAHVKGIVIGEAALKHGEFDKILDAYHRYPETRNEIIVYGTAGSIEDLFTAVPVLNLSPIYSRLISPMDIHNQFSVLDPVTMREFDMGLHEPARTLIFPYLVVSKNRWTENKDSHPSIKIDGTAILKQGTFKGVLNTSEEKGLRWVQKKSSRAPLYLTEQGKPVGVISITKPKAKVKMRLENGVPRFSLQVKADGTIIESLASKSTKEYAEMGEKKMEEEIRELYKSGLKIHADPLQLEETLYREDPQLWQRLTQHGDLQLDEKSLEAVETKIKVSSSGKNKLQKKN